MESRCRRQPPADAADIERGGKTPSEIVTHFDFTLPALSTHLEVLSDAGLVSERKKGQNRFYSVNRDSMSEI